MSVIQKSVGKGGINEGSDVMAVEFLLNRVMSKIYPEQWGVQPDGTVSIPTLRDPRNVDSETVRAIETFQKRVCGFRWPDGRVDPGNRTIKRLVAEFLADGGVVRLDAAQATKRIVPNSVLERGGSLSQSGTHKAGSLRAGLDGSRLVLSITRTETIFILLDAAGPGSEARELNPMRGIPGTIYSQRTQAFLDEWDSVFWHKIALRLQPVKALIELEINVMLAMISCAGPAGMALVLGVDAIQFIVVNREKFPVWAEMAGVLLSVRGTLKKYAPTFYDKLISAIFYGTKRSALAAVGFAGDDVIENVPAAMAKDPKTTGRLIGALVGNLGKAAFAARMTLIGVILALVKTLVTKAVLAVPGAIGLTAAEKVRTANEFVIHFRKIGVPIAQEEAMKIVEELTTHAREVRDAVERMNQAIVTLVTLA